MESMPQGLKPVDFIAFIQGVKPPAPSVLSFSASCEVVPFQNIGSIRGP